MTIDATLKLTKIVVKRESRKQKRIQVRNASKETWNATYFCLIQN